MARHLSERLRRPSVGDSREPARRPPRAGVPRSRARSGRRTPRRTSRGRGRNCHPNRGSWQWQPGPPSVRARVPTSSHTPGRKPHRRGVHRLHDRRTLAVPQLADVEVPVDAVDRRWPAPSRASRRSRTASGAGPRRRADRGWRKLLLPRKGSSTDAWASLAWRNSGSLVVVADQEHDPGAGADAADADHLAGGVAEAEPLQEVPVIPSQGSAVGVQDVLQSVLDLVGLLVAGISSWIRTIIGGSLTRRGRPSTTSDQLGDRPSCCPSTGPWPRSCGSA